MTEFEFIMPHIKYIAATDNLAQYKRGTFIGNQSHSGLVSGGVYELYTVAYAPTRDKQRIIVWAARRNDKTVYHVNLTDFKIVK